MGKGYRVTTAGRAPEHVLLPRTGSSHHRNPDLLPGAACMGPGHSHRGWKHGGMVSSQIPADGSWGPAMPPAVSVGPGRAQGIHSQS